MKKILSIVIGAVSFGLIAGLVMVGVNVFSVQTGIVKNSPITNAFEQAFAKEEEKANGATISEIKTEKRSYNYNSRNYNDLTELIDDVMPTVVSITNMQKFKQNGYSMFGFRVQPQEYEAPASGSGVIVGMTDEQIIILTNSHVIESSSSLSVTFNDSETVDAAIKGSDSSIDLAIISVDKKNVKKEILDNIKVSRIGNSSEVKVGEQVVAIGNALGIGQSVTSGIVSAKDRTIDAIDNAAKLIQIDAAINPGNSGGALINMRGELIGINVAKSSGSAIEGMGYVIPINDAKDVIEKLSKRADRKAIPENEQGQLGIQAKNIDAQTAQSLDMPEGIYVYKISDDSSVKNSELKEKDIIVSFDDQNVKTVAELQELLKYTRAGQEVVIKVKRLDGGSYIDKSFTVKLGKKKVEEKKSETKPEVSESSVSPDNNQSGRYYYDPFEDFDDIFRNFGAFGW